MVFSLYKKKSPRPLFKKQRSRKEGSHVVILPLSNNSLLPRRRRAALSRLEVSPSAAMWKQQDGKEETKGEYIVLHPPSLAPPTSSRLPLAPSSARDGIGQGTRSIWFLLSPKDESLFEPKSICSIHVPSPCKCLV